MPRARKPSKPSLPERTLIIDNGGSTIKAGFAPSTPSSSPTIDLSACHIIPNCLAKLPGGKATYVGAQLNQCRDFAEMLFRRPVQHGQLVNWESEREIWTSSFFDLAGGAASGLVLPCEAPQETSLLLTEAPNSLPNLQSNADQIVFEEFEFAAYRRVPGPVLNAYADVAGIFGDRAVQSENDGANGDAAGRSETVEEEMETDGGQAEPPTSTADKEGSAVADARPLPQLGRGLATSECVMVVDCGFSHTTVTPIYQGRPIQQAVRRLEVGGKLLTNHLKETLSLRQLDLTHEYHIVNEMKEDACFVTLQLREDLERTWKHGPKYEPKIRRQQQQEEEAEAKKAAQEDDEIEDADDNENSEHAAMDVDDDDENKEQQKPSRTQQQPDQPFTINTTPTNPYAQGIVLDYVMPDYTTRFRGSILPHDPSTTKLQTKLRQFGSTTATGPSSISAQDTILTLANERFLTPELLFSPTDIGLQQAGLAEVVMQSVRAMPPGLWPAMLGNVLLVGGTAKLPGLRDRLYAELRPLVPVEIKVRVRTAPEPDKATWVGGARLVSRAQERGLLGEVFVTRQEYLENGEGWVRRMFAGEKPLPW